MTAALNKKIRLNRYIAQCGVCSRRSADIFIKEGKVSVNGIYVTEPGVCVNPETDAVAVNGAEISQKSGKVYIMLNKPGGCVTTARDPYNRRTVFYYLKDIGTRIYPVGRLDCATTGLLLLTNDGDYAYGITHPKNKIKKTYIAGLYKKPPETAINTLRAGIAIKEGETLFKTAPAAVSLKKKQDGYELSITIHEGRNRQVRKMCAAAGISIKSLTRVSIGGLTLGRLKPGEYRFLDQKEAQRVFKG